MVSAPSLLTRDCPLTFLGQASLGPVFICPNHWCCTKEMETDSNYTRSQKSFRNVASWLESHASTKNRLQWTLTRQTNNLRFHTDGERANKTLHPVSESYRWNDKHHQPRYYPTPNKGNTTQCTATVHGSYPREILNRLGNMESTNAQMAYTAAGANTELSGKTSKIVSSDRINTFRVWFMLTGTVTYRLVCTASGLKACPKVLCGTKQNWHAGKYLQDPTMLCVCMWSLCGSV